MLKRISEKYRPDMHHVNRVGDVPYRAGFLR